jgi:hypothetical protein
MWEVYMAMGELGLKVLSVYHETMKISNSNSVYSMSGIIWTEILTIFS